MDTVELLYFRGGGAVGIIDWNSIEDLDLEEAEEVAVITIGKEELKHGKQDS